MAPLAVLDVGCGFGWLLDRVGDGAERYGMDVSAHAAAEARARCAGAAIVQGDLEDGVPFRRRFEAVLAINVIEHLRRPEAAVRAIHEALAPGGIAVVHLPTVNNAVSRLVYRLCYDRDPTHIYRPSGNAVREVFEARGFALLRESYWPHAPRVLWNPLRWHPAYLAVFRRS